MVVVKRREIPQVFNRTNPDRRIEFAVLQLRRIAIVLVGTLSIACTGTGTSGSAPAPSGAATGGEADCLTIDQVKAKDGWDVTIEIPDYEPFWFEDDSGALAGLDVDLLAEVNKRLEIPETRRDLIPFNGVLPALSAGRGDFVPVSLAITEERKASFGFSHPFADATIILMTKADSDIETSDDLGGRVVGVQQGAAADLAIKSLNEELTAAGSPIKEIKEYQNLTDLFLDLGHGRIEVVAQTRPPVAAYMNKQPGEFRINGPVGDPIYTGWVFRPEDVEPGCIGDSINQVLAELRQEGFIDALQEKWLGGAVELPAY
jgi:polar amino acid transport system substrate-binding protein